MKEFNLFKEQTLPTQVLPPVKTHALSGQSEFSFHEIAEVSAIHEYDYEVSEGATLEAVLLQSLPADHRALIRVRTRVGRNATLKLTIVQDGASESEIDLFSEAKASGARIEIRGLQNAKGNQKFLMKAGTTHSVPHTFSDLQVWCVARGDSRTVFNGLIKIEQTAPYTEAFQKNKNLILSKSATIDSYPKLLISNDNVKCAHGSSTSTLEPDQAYYLQARGISNQDAEQMLLKGFIRQAISWISDDQTRHSVQDRLGVREEAWS
jgi:Fe-S cluster assembly protein SufD